MGILSFNRISRSGNSAAMNKLLIIGAILGFVSVMMGALSDHAFELTPDKAESLATAIRYNMLYAILVSTIALASPEKKMTMPGAVFAIGTVLFSFSIYAALFTRIEALIYVTPIGGVTIMAGWIALAYRAIRYKN